MASNKSLLNSDEEDAGDQKNAKPNNGENTAASYDVNETPENFDSVDENIADQENVTPNNVEDIMTSNDVNEMPDIYHSADEIIGDQENATPNNENKPAGANVEAGNNNANRNMKKYSLPCLLRCLLFSPLKWKEDACWCSVPHLILFLFHVAKIVALTVLTFNFGTCRAGVSTLTNNRYIVLHHLLLEHWDIGLETLPYPPAHGQFAVYTVDDLRSGINYTVAQFYNAENEATGNFKRTRDDHITINVQYHDRMKDLSHKNKSRIVKKSCQVIPNAGLVSYINEEGQRSFTYNVDKDLIASNLKGVLKSVFEVNLTFSLHAVRADYENEKAVCHQITGNVSFHDYDQDGQLAIDLIVNHFTIKCSELGLLNEDSLQCYHDPETVLIIVTCLASVTAVLDIGMLGFYLLYLCPCWRKKNFSVHEWGLNIQWWLFISLLADILCLIGVCGILSELSKGDENSQLRAEKESELKRLDGHIIYLGYGYLLTLLSSLRFIRINHKFSILFKTIRRSAPDIFFFLICVTILFFGFWVSSMIVLGPYNTKFRTESSAFETLFSLIQSDELYATLAILEDSNSGDRQAIWLFSRVIIVGYVSLFTVFVFNLLIAMFNNAYETVKEEYKSKSKKRGFTRADMSRNQMVQVDQDGPRDTKENTAESSNMEPSLFTYMWSDVDETKCCIYPGFFKWSWKRCCKCCKKHHLTAVKETI